MKTTGLFELYERDPDHADQVVFGRTSLANRRGFLRGAGLATMSAMAGGVIPFARNIPSPFLPVALANDVSIVGKDGLTLLNDRPLCAETPPHLLDDFITPTSRHFIRNNGIAPPSVDTDEWTLTVDGLVNAPMTFSIADLRSQFEVVTEALTIECAGNGRAFFDPGADGCQWSLGAVACSRWTGVRLADVLGRLGVASNAVYTAHYGADAAVGDPTGQSPISRGIPIEKALDPHTLIAFAQNGEAIHPMSGAPLRLVVPGWPGSCSQKWLTRVQIRDRMHDGRKMLGKSYRVPDRRLEAGEELSDENFKVIESMPVKSLITHPRTGLQMKSGEFQVRGHAWAGDRTVAKVELSSDFGASWQNAEMDQPINPYAWQNFRAILTLDQPGYYEIWARATDATGRAQPYQLFWNPKGYLNNSLHRIAVRVVA